ncbi:portal protein [Paenibacillus sp. FSL L8-0499]|uniref:portal protein n=1 Tax=Paenibacillus sp. FSL L8-0499 TaxID=2975334 RepID=UPI0030F8AD12
MAELLNKAAFAMNDEKTEKRRDVQSEEDCKLADKLLDWHRSSHLDKDNRGLFDKWETIDSYWEGDANEPDSDTDPASNTNIINPNVEGQVAYLIEQNLSVQTKGRGPSDVPFADMARIVLEFVKDQNKMRRKLDVHERRRMKFGTGIFRVLFDPDLLDEMGLPVIEPCNPAYIFTDPNVTDIYKVNEGRFLIEVLPKSISAARQSLVYDEDLIDAIEPGYDPMYSSMIFNEDEGVNDSLSKDHYLHMLVWFRDKVPVKDDEDKDDEDEEVTDKDKAERKKKTKYEWRMRLVEMSGCGIILRDTKDDKDFVIPKNRFPYFFTPDMYREGTTWAKGTAELLVNTQDLINDIDDQIRINGRLTGNPQRWINTGSGIDPDKVTNEGGLVIPTDMIGEQSMGFFDPPNMPQYILNRRDQAIGTERQIQSRFGDQQMGVQQSGVDTATESLAIQQGANAGVTHKKMLLEETLGDMFEYILDLVMEYWTEEQAFRITEREDNFEFFRPSDLKEVPVMVPATPAYQQIFMQRLQESGMPAEAAPQYMPLKDEQGQQKQTKRASFDINITVGSGLPSNKGFVYTLIREAFRDGVIPAPTYAKLLREYAGLPINDDDIQALTPPAQQPGMEQMGNPLIQGLTGQGAPQQPGLSVMTGGMGM